MSGDPADLANLRDLALPPAISWWPPAPGWWVVAAGLLAAVALLAWREAQRFRADVYRRAALRELGDLDGLVGAVDARMLAARISEVLKRAALVAYPRESVAALSGPAWIAFLDRSAGMMEFADGAARIAMNSVYGPASPAIPEQLRATIAAARRWVRAHRSPPGDRGGSSC